MTVAISMLAPNATANQTYTCKSGNSYTSDAYGIIHSVIGPDIIDLVGSDCVTLGQLGARNNNGATTNPGTTNDSTQDYAIGSHWLNKNTGVEYVCTSATASAAVWYAVNGSYLGLPWITAQFYGIPLGSTQAAVLTVLGTLYAYPIFIPNAVTISSISMGSTTGQTGGKMRAALFADNGAGYPGAIVPGTDTGDLAATTTAVATKSSLTAAVGPGWYWVGSIFTASSTMPSVTGITAIYGNSLNALLGSDTAAHALTVSAEAASGISVGTQTYPATNMATSFPTFPASATLTLAATTPVAILGV